MRILVLALSCLLVMAVHAREPRIRHVDLDLPGAIERLEKYRPADFRAYIAVMKASRTLPCGMQEVRALEAQYSVRNMECGGYLMTSYPAKGSGTVEFEVGKVHYSKQVSFLVD